MTGGGPMSFSSSVKDEVAKIKVKDKNLITSEISGLLATCGAIMLKGENLILSFNTENPSVARRIFTFLKSYSKDVEASIRKNYKLRKNKYSISLFDTYAVKSLLDKVYIGQDKRVFTLSKKKPRLTEEEKRAFVRGCFLGSGSVTNPEKTYHFEIIFENRGPANYLMEILSDYDIKPGLTLRKDKYLIYLKEAEKISDFLSLIGASKSVLEFENIRVIKEMRNNVNRLVNMETANLNKIVNSSLDQVNDILYIDKEIGLNSLDENLREVALLRLENRESSLRDIGNLLNPKIGKSAVNYRMKKLREIAKLLRSGDYGNKRNKTF